MPKKPTPQLQLLADNAALHARLEQAEQTLSEIFSGEADALMIPSVGGVQLFTLKGVDQTYRLLIEEMSEGALILTPDGLVLYANRRFAEMLEIPLEKVIGSEIHNWFATESRPTLQSLLQKDVPINQHEELALTAADGAQVSVYLSVSRLVLDETPDTFCMVVTDLTEQKRKEAILAAEKLSNAILEQAADAIVICDENGRIMRASNQTQAFYGKTPLGQQFEQAFPLRNLDGTSFSVVSAIDTNHSLSVEARLEGSEQGFDLLVSVGHLRGAEDKLLGYVVTLTDITERKTAELALQKNEKQLSEALTIARLGYWEYEYSTDEFIFNDQYYLLHKITAEDAGGYRMSSSDFASRYMYAEDVDRMGQDIQLAFESRDPDYFAKAEARILSGKGEIIWVDVRFRILKDLQGNTIRMIGVNQDITERKHAELTLQESEQRFTDLLDNVEMVSVMRDREERITYCNEYLLRLTGRGHEEVIGQNWVELFLPSEIAEKKKKFYKELLLDRPEARHNESEILTCSGEHRLIRWNNTVLRAEDGEVIGTASIGEDITERKKADANIKYLNRVLSVLSGINTLIVRVNDRDELFREACNIAVEKGGFRMAMLVIVDQSTMLPVSVTSAGKDKELLASIKDVMSTSEGMQTTLITRSIREKKIIISNDTQIDSRLLFSKQYAEAGVNSMTVLPLMISDEAIGTFVLYAREIEFFQKDEMKLLTELAGDIAFAIDHIDKQERLNYLAYYDVLTGLANRTLFLERLTQYMRSAVNGRHKLAIGLIDLERFKSINDSLSRSTGDLLLKLIAEWLAHKMGDANLLARIDADHFAIVLPEIKSDGNLPKLIENLISAFLEHPFNLNEAIFRIGIKVGIAQFPDDGDDADTLFRNAEAALKKAKKSGDRYLFHAQKMTESVAGKLAMENQLRRAIDNEEFVLHYQPKVNLVSGQITSAEALIRWNDPHSGLVPPGKFIPILEEIGLIYEVGRWALRKAIEDNLRWRAAGLAAVRIAVNVSPLQLRNINFIDEIKRLIALDTDAAAKLELEITESVIMNNIELNIATLQTIRAMGITIAIDDFGTGFSSLSYLAKLPVDTLKIDRSFVIEMTEGPEGLALVSTIISLAHALSLKVVAEGVETEEQSRLLRLLQCDEIQGFLFSKPVPAEIFEARFLIPVSRR